MTIFHNHRVVAENIPWLKDSARNQFYKSAIEDIVKGRRVLEAGPGSGLLMQYALDAGADFVTGVEIRKDRAKFLNEIFSSQGHKNFEILNCDFMSLDSSILKRHEIIICEQTGDQFKNDCQLPRFFDKVKHDNLITIPDTWSIDIHLYDGAVETSAPLVLNDTIPATYQSSIKQMSYPQATESFYDLWKVTNEEGYKDINIDLDLTGYKDCTILIDDHVSFKGKRCPYLTGYESWQKPVQIMIPDAKGHYNIYLEEGKWKHRKK